MTEWLIYSESGFNIVEAEDRQEAEMLTGQDVTCLDAVEDVDTIIIDRIRELLK